MRVAVPAGVGPQGQWRCTRRADQTVGGRGQRWPRPRSSSSGLSETTAPLLLDYGQAADAEACLFEDDDAALVGSFCDLSEVVQQNGRLLAGLEPGRTPEQDDRRACGRGPGEQGAELGVGRDEDAVLGPGELKDLGVLGALHPKLAVDYDYDGEERLFGDRP